MFGSKYVFVTLIRALYYQEYEVVLESPTQCLVRGPDLQGSRAKQCFQTLGTGDLHSTPWAFFILFPGFGKDRLLQTLVYFRTGLQFALVKQDALAI